MVSFVIMRHREHDPLSVVRPSTEEGKKAMVTSIGTIIRDLARAIRKDPSPTRAADSLMGVNLREKARALRIVAETPVPFKRR